MEHGKYVRFDWAAKYVLRDKENHGILEGFLSVLLKENIQIIDILESESNQDAPDSKFNRVDIKAKDSKGEIIIIEIQLNREVDFLERILFGVAKAITEHIKLGDSYDKVKKVYSISILYFDIRKGDDYIYYGQNTIRGLNTGNKWELSDAELDAIKIKNPKDIFPEYYFIMVEAFNKEASTPLEEWLDYFKNENIKDNTTVPGLQEAKEKLQYLKMSPEQRKSYDRRIEDLVIEKDVLGTQYRLGLFDGREEEKKRSELKIKTLAKELKSLGVSIEIIIQTTRLTKEEIEEL